MKKLISTVAVLAALTTAAVAEESKELEARHGEMTVLALNLGVLGGMAKGAVPYDAAMAKAAADSVAGVAMIDQKLLFPEGTAQGALEGSRALPAVWEKWDDFAAKWGALGEAATAMQTAAAGGQEAIGPAMGALGGACKGCHDTYRAPE